MWVCECSNVCTVCTETWRGPWILELELLTAVNCPLWMLETKPRPSKIAANAKKKNKKKTKIFFSSLFPYGKLVYILPVELLELLIYIFDSIFLSSLWFINTSYCSVLTSSLFRWFRLLWQFHSSHLFIFVFCACTIEFLFCPPTPNKKIPWKFSPVFF